MVEPLNTEPKSSTVHSSEKNSNFFSSIALYTQKIGRKIIDILMPSVHQEVVKKISARHASREETIVLLHQTEAYHFIQNMHYPLETLDPEQRILLREMAAYELLPSISVENISSKRIREFIDLHRAYASKSKTLAPSIYKTNLEKVLKLLITCDHLMNENFIRGDDFDLDLSRLNDHQRILFIEAVGKDVISAEVLAKTSILHLIQYLDCK